jgi:type IV pilus assembly protein PilY1
MVDLSPTAFDVYIDPTGGTNPKWRTVIVGGERGGGDVFFAIDVTDPTNPIVLWEYPVFRNLAQVTKVSGNYLATYPYLTKSIYEQVAELPASWSIPYVGKLDLDDSVSFLAADRINTWTSGTPTLSISSRGSSSLSGWYAVVGHAPRIFSLDDLPTLSTDADVAKAQKLATLKPSLLLLAIQKGINIFQYTWPLMQATLTDLWPDSPAGDPSGTTYIPYATASPTVLDIWDSHGSFNPNGTMDHIYIGDLNGNFYGLKFNLEADSNATTAAKGIQMDVWQTKPVATADVNSNFYRSSREPISVAPVVSTNEELTNLLLYFGTGKYEDIQSTYNDKTDTAKMSFYSLKDNVTRPTISTSTTATKLSDSPTLFSMSGSTTSGFKLNGVGMQVTTHCTSPTYNSSCTWTTADGTADCCESDCASSCYACLYNLNFEGERVVDSALVAGGLVFFTTFVPKTDLCSVGGDAYLYIFSYLCVPLTSDPLADSGFSGTTLESLTSAGQYAAVGAGYVAKLGSGMPSRPVLDSSGEYVFIQTSDAQIHKIKVDLPVKPMELKGWKNEN